jgi:hypothetical protein
MGTDPAGSHSRFRAAMELRLQKDVPALSARLPCSADRVVDSKQVGIRCAGKEPAPEVVRFLGLDGQGWSVRIRWGQGNLLSESAFFDLFFASFHAFQL